MKTLKDLLTKEAPVPGQEMTINIETVKVPQYRTEFGDLAPLGQSIETNGLRHPITVWTDGTMISGARRHRAHFLLAGEPGKQKYRHIRAMFVDTIEDAAKRLLTDNTDEGESRPMKPSEICHLWQMLKKLDEPAAIKRADEARRRGVELRRATMSGKRAPGRSSSRGNEYVLGVIAEPFGMSEATASRLMTIYAMSTSLAVEPERRNQAAAALALLDAGESSIWECYSRLAKKRSLPGIPKPSTPAQSVPASRQRAAWDRALPQLEGLTSGLSELGAPNPDLTWEQVGPVVQRLSGVRRDLEKIIKKMRETAQS